DRDPIVPPSQAQEFVDALEGAGVEDIYRLYKGESHGFVRAETIIDSLESEFVVYVDVFGIPRDRPTGGCGGDPLDRGWPRRRRRPASRPPPPATGGPATSRRGTSARRPRPVSPPSTSRCRRCR